MKSGLQMKNKKILKISVLLLLCSIFLANFIPVVKGAEADVSVTYNPKLPKHTVSFASNGHGSLKGNKKILIVEGTGIDPSTVPTPTPDGGYIFSQWKDDSGKNITDWKSLKIMKDQTFTAYFSPITQYTVNFKAEIGGSLIGKTSVKVNKGSKVSAVPTVKLTSGYTFKGWFTKDNKNVDPRTIAIMSNMTFTAKFDKKPVQVKKKALYRLYNPNSGEHFYTANPTERDKVKKAGWRYEGIGWYAPEKGMPVYRMYNPNNGGDHHYTLNANERDHLKKVGWRYEGISWFSGGKISVYRLYNPNAKTGTHHYTINKNENDHLAKVGWRKEGVGWYAQ